IYGIQTTVGINQARQAYPIRSITDGRYKLIWNLLPENKFTNIVTEIDRCEYFQSWRALAKTDAHARDLVTRYQIRPQFELYDLNADPDELHNISNRPEHSDRIAVLHKKLQQWMTDQGDQGIPTEMEANAHQTLPRPLRTQP
ncbi:DUF4976 domain-containing protein, partial [bacterium AH-315-P07]|nr:DUF4976 domain-containing protein [bacterium AH-315-P07]